MFFVVEVDCISVVGEVFVIIREEDIFCVFIGIEEDIILEKIRWFVFREIIWFLEIGFLLCVMDVVEGFFDGKIEDKLNFEEDGVVVEIFVGLYFV